MDGFSFRVEGLSLGFRVLGFGFGWVGVGVCAFRWVYMVHETYNYQMELRNITIRFPYILDSIYVRDTQPRECLEFRA